ncbi:aminopeptidase [Bavariicoccus seileri]|uniref:aminopeptidase n=1 Tax=Bavariicoccus seileri TaxID=549685 RepID=UPI0003B3E34B|nr:aminopeptidase [Bavariicoccus seileri]
MNFQLLKKLSNADAIASNENEVRSIIKDELKEYKDSFEYDGLGSLIVTKKCKKKDAATIMFAAHMDEVGFMVRYISDIGFAFLIPIGSVEERAKSMQLVRVTTKQGEKIEGLLNSLKDSEGKVNQIYVDFGFDSREEVEKSGIDVGDMVCFATNFRLLKSENIVAGKAMDDRVGCYSLIKAMQSLVNVDLDVNIVAAFTSSEEVGTRGGKLVSKIVSPDLFFAIDVAKNPELDRGYRNTRRLGRGVMLEFFDKTMVPNPRLLGYIMEIAKDSGIEYQKDMFKGGGTDAGSAHMENGGIISSVLGLPLRYCHDPYSLANMNDVKSMQKLIKEIALRFNDEKIKDLYSF